MALVPVGDYPDARTAWLVCRAGDTLDVPPGTWDVEPHAAGYPALRADYDDLAIRLAPGAVLRLRPGGRDGMIVGSNGATGPRRGLHIYGGGTLRSWSTAHAAVLWTSTAAVRTLSDLTLEDVAIEGGRDGLYVGAYTAGTTLLRGIAVRTSYRYGVGVGRGAAGLLRLEHVHVDRPSIASAVPHALHVETDTASPTIRVEVVDHSSFDAAITLGGVAGWLLEDVALRDGVVLLTHARSGVLRDAVLQWTRPPGSSARVVSFRHDCSGSVVERATLLNGAAALASDDVEALSVGESDGITLRDLLIVSPAPGPALVTRPSTVVEDVDIVLVPR